MIHPAQKDKSTSDFGQHAARASSNYTCMQYFARGAAESMLYRCLLGSNGKGFRLQLHTPTSYNAKKPLGGLLAKLPICFSARATVADPRAPRGRDLTCLDPSESSHSPALPITKGKAVPHRRCKFANLRTTNHRTRRASDRRRSREQKAQCLELESVPLPGRAFPCLCPSVSSKRGSDPSSNID
jgi:hypothetical protein